MDSVQILCGKWFIQVQFVKKTIIFSCVEEQNPSETKLTEQINFSQVPDLSSFGTIENLQQYLLAQGANRCRFSQENSIIALFWNVCAQQFQRQLKYEIKLQTKKLKQNQKLEYQVKILKKKLNDIKNIYKINEQKQLADIGSKINKINNQNTPQKQSLLQNNPEINFNKQNSAFKLCNELKEGQVSKDESVQSSSYEIIVEKPKNIKQAVRQRPKKQRIKKTIQKNRKTNRRKQATKDLGKCEQSIDFNDPAQNKRQSQKKVILKNGIKRTVIGSKVKLEFQNGDYYFGQVKNTDYHGKGKCFFKNFGTYEGQWKYSKRDGYGKYLDSDNNLYEGQFKQDKRSGKGTQFFYNGQKYVGEYKNDCRQGYGIYYFSNGDRYEGQWRNDTSHGKGKQVFSDGSMFQGSWIDDERDGEGIFTNKNGSFKQIWQNGILKKQIQLKK